MNKEDEILKETPEASPTRPADQVESSKSGKSAKQQTARSLQKSVKSLKASDDGRDSQSSGLRKTGKSKLMEEELEEPSNQLIASLEQIKESNIESTIRTDPSMDAVKLPVIDKAKESIPVKEEAKEEDRDDDKDELQKTKTAAKATHK